MRAIRKIRKNKGRNGKTDEPDRSESSYIRRIVNDNRATGEK